MVDQVILQKYFEEKILRPKTIQSYRQTMHKLTTSMRSVCNVHCVKQITRETLLAWRAHELHNGLTAISWNSYCRHLSTLFTFAIKQGLVQWPENHFNTLQLRTPKKMKKTLSDEKIIKIQQELDALVRDENMGRYNGRLHPVWFWRIVFETLYYTGMRRNQLLHVRLRDVNLIDGTIFVRIEGSKGHNENIIPIPHALLDSLSLLVRRAKQRCVGGNDQLFNVTCFGKNRYTYNVMRDANISNAFRELSERVKFPASPHRLRHTLGTQLMRQPGKNLHLVKAILGHSDVRTTLEYVEPDIGDMRDLMNSMPNLAK